MALTVERAREIEEGVSSLITVRNSRRSSIVPERRVRIQPASTVELRIKFKTHSHTKQ